MKAFSILDVLKELNNVTYTFNDSSTISFSVNDFINFSRWKTKNIPTWSDNQLDFLSNLESFETYFNQFNLETKDNFSRIKDALGLDYNVLDNYNGHIESTTRDTFNEINALSFNNRQDTRTLNYNDTLSFTNRQDTRTLNTTDTDRVDSNDPITSTTTTGESRTENHYSTGYNSEVAELNTRDVTTADSDDNITETVESGTRTNTQSGTITDGKSGSEQNSHSGTITDGKSGGENNTHTGTVTHTYEEDKAGNIGVTTSQQMLESELELRLRYKLRPMIIKSFIDEYFYI